LCLKTTEFAAAAAKRRKKTTLQLSLCERKEDDVFVATRLIHIYFHVENCSDDYI